MSLIGTLARVGLALAATKGIGALVNRGTTGGGGGLLDAASRGGSSAAAKGGGLEDLLGSVLGGQTGSGGGLGDILSKIGGAGNARGGAGGGGLEDLLGGLLGGAAAKRMPVDHSTAGAGSSHGMPPLTDLLNQAFARKGEPEVKPTAEQEVAAGLMLSAMIQAAKADGKVDDAERAKLLEKLGDTSADERRFVQAELDKPIDVDGLARDVPKGMEEAVYTVSVLAIDLDDRAEAEYLHKLASAFGLTPSAVNDIHARLGVPALYR